MQMLETIIVKIKAIDSDGYDTWTEIETRGSWHESINTGTGDTGMHQSHSITCRIPEAFVSEEITSLKVGDMIQHNGVDHTVTGVVDNLRGLEPHYKVVCS